MTRLVRMLLAATLLVASISVVSTQEAEETEKTRPAAEKTEPLPEEYSCTFCHADKETFFDDTQHLLVTEQDLVSDIHWQEGLRCHDCHGGNPKLDEYVDHREDPGFRGPASPADIPKFCGHCHSNLEYMRHYSPSARTDQEMEYWTSGHGKRLKATMDDEEEGVDEAVATCVDCHGRHGILAVNDQNCEVYPSHVAKTCARCHSDEEMMAGRTYHDRPLGHDQYEAWQRSVHGRAMLEKGDLSAPTCNDCHGNHGAVPPGLDSVANACGTCHGKVAKLFAETRMKHRFEDEDVHLPGCAACHGNLDAGGNPNVHDIRSLPDEDQMLGVTGDGVCARCHGDGEDKYGRAGADVAAEMREGLEELKGQIREAEMKVAEAERKGMEVRGPRFDLRQAFDALTNARSLVHSFAVAPVNEALDGGRNVTTRVVESAEKALAEHTFRRVWLAATLVPILIVVGLLVFYIRTLPLPKK